MSAAYDDRSNPFSTRFVRPGALPYLFAHEGGGLDVLVRQLAAHDWRGAIVGAHGSGKSTLLAALRPALERAGMRVELVVLRQGQRRLPTLDPLPLPVGPTLLVIDGYEQLSWLARLRLAWMIRRRGWGLLVTSHAEVGLPVLVRTSTDLATAIEIVERLMPPGDASISSDDVRQAFAACEGDLREMLFRLYDLYESRRPATGE